MRQLTSKKILLLFVFLLGFLLLIRGSSFLITSNKVRLLTKVSDPIGFTKNFDIIGKQSTRLPIKSRGFFWPSGRVITSPYFPHKELSTISIEAYKCPRRYLNIDKFWNIFWVEIVECGEHTKLFGPYFSDDVMNFY